MPIYDSASVKVMRSFDYCHFEVNLGKNEGAITEDTVDEMRKEAARLADKAVRQYQIAKEVIQARESAESELDWRWQRPEIEKITALPETERTPEQQAYLKAYKDACLLAHRNYDYQDDWT